MPPTPITILTGFLGSGKTTLILNLIPQLPRTYRLALLKNEFGDVAIDSELASSASIAGVRELLNGCICCNLVGQLGDALETLRAEQKPDRIVIETSGSAFPATLAMEVNRLIREGGGENFVLDGVVSVVDVENWAGYEDTSVTAKMQAKFTDLVVLNKWEDVGERRFDECLDRLGDLEGVVMPWVKSDRGRVGMDLLLGVDGSLARGLLGDQGQEKRDGERDHENGHGHGHAHDRDSGDSHQSEVEVLSITLSSTSSGKPAAIDPTKLSEMLASAPKDEIYRIKAVLYLTRAPKSSSGDLVPLAAEEAHPKKYILNFAFERWTFTAISSTKDDAKDAALRMTIITARYESTKWKRKIEEGGMLALEGEQGDAGNLTVARVS